jgi:hypothetical protein
MNQTRTTPEFRFEGLEKSEPNPGCGSRFEDLGFWRTCSNRCELHVFRTILFQYFMCFAHAGHEKKVRRLDEIGHEYIVFDGCLSITKWITTGTVSVTRKTKRIYTSSPLANPSALQALLHCCAACKVSALGLDTTVAFVPPDRGPCRGQELTVNTAVGNFDFSANPARA